MDTRSESDAGVPTTRRTAERPESSAAGTPSLPDGVTATEEGSQEEGSQSVGESPRQAIEEAQTVIRYPSARRDHDDSAGDQPDQVSGKASNRNTPGGQNGSGSRRRAGAAGGSENSGDRGNEVVDGNEAVDGNDGRSGNRHTEAETGSGRNANAGRNASSSVAIRGGSGHETGLPQTPAALTRALEGKSLNHFHLIEQIGGGGMGAVFRAYDERLGRTVAVKVIPFADGDPDLKRRFRNEAQSAARLDHPLIARVFEVGNDGPWHYIVFEYVDGQNVRDRVLQDGPLTLDDAVFITSQLAEAIGHASQRGIVHRDIKPSNVIVTSEGAIKLVDMGLARSEGFETSEDLTASGVTLGTFDYISPEQARDPRLADIRSDLYSLGCTFFFMLTGSPPFPGGTMLQKLLSHGNAAIPDIRESRSDASEDLAAVLEKMLAKQPDDRYQNSVDLVADLRELAEREELSRSRGIHPMPQPERSAGWERLRWHLPWMVAASVLVVSAAWLEVASWQTRSDFNASVRATVSPRAMESIPPFQPPADDPWNLPSSSNPVNSQSRSGSSTPSERSPSDRIGAGTSARTGSSGDPSRPVATSGIQNDTAGPTGVRGAVTNPDLATGVAAPQSGAGGPVTPGSADPAVNGTADSKPLPLRPTPFPASSPASDPSPTGSLAAERPVGGDPARPMSGAMASELAGSPAAAEPTGNPGTGPPVSAIDGSAPGGTVGGTGSSGDQNSGSMPSPGPLANPGPMPGDLAIEGIGEGAMGSVESPDSASSDPAAAANDGGRLPLVRRPSDPPSLGGFPMPVDYEGLSSGTGGRPIVTPPNPSPLTPGSVAGTTRPVPFADDLEPPVFPSLDPNESAERSGSRPSGNSDVEANGPPIAISKPRLVRVVAGNQYASPTIREQAAVDRAILATSLGDALQQAETFQLDLIEIATQKLITDPVQVRRSDLLIRSTIPGGSVIVCRSRDEVDMQRSELISIGSNRIELVNLHFVWAVPATETDGGALLSMAENRQVRLTDCTITIENPSRREEIHAFDIATDESTASADTVDSSTVTVPTLPLVSIELYNVIVRGQISMIHMHDAAELQLLWENGLLAVSGRLLETAGSSDRPRPTSGAIQLSMTRLTALVPAGLVRMRLTNGAPYPVRIERKAEESVFVSDRGAPHVEISGVSRSDREGTWLRLRGASNAYETDASLSDPLLLVRDEFSQVQTVSMNDLLGEMPPEWSEEKTPRWVVRWSEPLPERAPPSRLVPADFRQDGSLVGGFQERFLPRLPM